MIYSVHDDFQCTYFNITDYGLFYLKIKNRGRSYSTVGVAFAFYAADVGQSSSIPCISYDPQICQEGLLRAEWV